MNVENFSLNIQLFYLINHSRARVLDYFFTYFYLLGKGYVLIPALLFVLLFKKKELPVFVLGVLFESLSVRFLKSFFKAPRPATLLKDAYLLEPVHLKSFPSGDTAMAFFLAPFFSQGSPHYAKLLLWLYAFLIAYGRVYMGAHFPLDVVAGALIGIASYFLALIILKAFRYVFL